LVTVVLFPKNWVGKITQFSIFRLKIDWANANSAPTPLQNAKLQNYDEARGNKLIKTTPN